MKLETIVREDENGEPIEVAKKDYLLSVVKDNDVKAYESEQVGVVDPIKVVQSIFTAACNGKDQPEELSDNYGDVVLLVTADVEFTKKFLEERKTKAADEKAAEKAKKEADKKKKEEDAAALVVRQGEFNKEVSAGADKASEAFIGEITALKDNLPNSVQITKSGDGFGIVLDDKVTDAEMGNAIGYLVGTSNNSEFLANQVQFFIGDLAGASVKKGLFATALECSKVISGHLANEGKRIAPGAIDTYRRMAERTDPALRNPKADPTAYLELSRMKRPKKDDKEKKEAFEKRLAKFDADIVSVQEKLSKGEAVARKDILPAVQEIKYAHGIEVRPDPNEVKVTVTDMLKLVFLGQMLLDNSVGAYKDEKGEIVEGQLCFADPSSPGDLLWVTESEMEEKIEEAKANLLNVFVKGKKHSVKEALQGFKKEEKEVPVSTDADGKAITEKRQVEVPVILPAFFPVAKEEVESGKEEAATTK